MVGALSWTLYANSGRLAVRADGPGERLALYGDGLVSGLTGGATRELQRVDVGREDGVAGGEGGGRGGSARTVRIRAAMARTREGRMDVQYRG